jgi:hypothetical protein
MVKLKTFLFLLEVTTKIPELAFVWSAYSRQFRLYCLFVLLVADSWLQSSENSQSEESNNIGA